MVVGVVAVVKVECTGEGGRRRYSNGRRALTPVSLGFGSVGRFGVALLLISACCRRALTLVWR